MLCTPIPNCPFVSGPAVMVTPQVLPAVLMAIGSRESKAFAVIAASADASAAGTVKVSPYTAGWFPERFAPVVAVVPAGQTAVLP